MVWIIDIRYFQKAKCEGMTTRMIETFKKKLLKVNIKVLNLTPFNLH